MSTALLDHTVLVIGGSAGIGLETARRARADGADVILTARNRERLEPDAREVRALSSAVFDATDSDQLAQFFEELRAPIDHITLTAGAPYSEPLAEMNFTRARRLLEEHLLLPLHVARNVVGRVRAAGTVLFVGGTGGRRPGVGRALGSAVTVGMPALVASMALELAPIRVNLIATGFVDTPLWASLLGDQLDARREELRISLPIRRVVGPEDVAALALHLMANTALTGATYDIDGGQQLIPR